MNTRSQCPVDRTSAQPQAVRGWKRVVYLLLAGVFLVVGALGALLPGLPATPFLLLTSALLVRSSPRLNAALLRSRFFGPILTDWQVHGGVRKGIKTKAVIVVVLLVGLTIVFSGLSLWPSLGVLSLAIIGIMVVVQLPTVGT